MWSTNKCLRHSLTCDLLLSNNEAPVAESQSGPFFGRDQQLAMVSAIFKGPSPSFPILPSEAGASLLGSWCGSRFAQEWR